MHIFTVGQFSQATFPAASATVPYPEAVNITIGDGFYQVVQWLPPGWSSI